MAVSGRPIVVATVVVLAVSGIGIDWVAHLHRTQSLRVLDDALRVLFVLLLALLDAAAYRLAENFDAGAGQRVSLFQLRELDDARLRRHPAGEPRGRFARDQRGAVRTVVSGGSGSQK